MIFQTSACHIAVVTTVELLENLKSVKHIFFVSFDRESSLIYENKLKVVAGE